MNVFQPLLAKNKVFVVPEVLDQAREERTTAKGSLLIYSNLKMKYTFYAEDGSSVSAVVIGEGMDSGDKASNKAMSVAMKYAMFQVFCIPTEEMHDSEEDGPEPMPVEFINATEIAVLKSLAEKYGKDVNDILKASKVPSLEKMDKLTYAKVMNRFKKLSGDN